MVSTDEACPNYADILRNFEMAHDWLRSEFNLTQLPKIGWQLDPFGHSAANAALFAQMGFDAIVFARINEQDREKRRETRDLQFIWTPEFVSDADDQQEIFAHLLYNHYSSPYFLPRDWNRMGQIDEGQVPEVARLWVDLLEDELAAAKTPNIIMIWGDDFAHKNDKSFYVLTQVVTAMEEEIAKRNLHETYSFSYSTMTKYF